MGAYEKKMALLRCVGKRFSVPTDEEYDLRGIQKIFEKKVIKMALQLEGGNRTHAAVLLGISHRGLLYKIKEYEIE